MEALAEELGVADRVLFLGYRTDIPQLLAACDVFALPSLYEGSSLAVLEAMAARRAVVSSAIGGTDELIEDGEDGVAGRAGRGRAAGRGAAPASRPTASAASDSAARARERVEADFTPAAMRERIVAIYEELLARGRRS